MGIHAARRLTSIEFSFDPCNIYRDCPRGVGYPADACSVGDRHPSCLVSLQATKPYRFSIILYLNLYLFVFIVYPAVLYCRIVYVFVSIYFI